MAEALTAVLRSCASTSSGWNTGQASQIKANRTGSTKDSLALQAVFYAIPYSHPIIASKAVVTGDYLTVVFGIVYVAVFTVAIMYVASRLFATEKILTAKLKLGKDRKKQPTD